MSSRDQPSPTLRQAVERFLAETTLGGRNPHLAALRQMQRPRVEGGLGDLRLVDVQPNVVADWLAALPPMTSRHARVALTQVLRLAVEDGAIAADLAARLSGVRVSQEQRVVRTLSLAELDAIAQCLPPELQALPRFGVATGLRPGELAALQWIDLVLDEPPLVHVRRTVNREQQVGQPRLSRSGGWRTVPLCALALEALNSHLACSGAEFVFAHTARDGQRFFTSPELSTLWRRACQRASVPFHSLYVLRETFAVENVQQGVPLQILAEWLGVSVNAVRQLGVPLTTFDWRPWPHYRRN